MYTQSIYRVSCKYDVFLCITYNMQSHSLKEINFFGRAEKKKCSLCNYFLFLSINDSLSDTLLAHLTHNIQSNK
jgi:hypothetical protein